MCFGTKTKSSQQTQSTQSGTSQSNLWDAPDFQTAMGNFWQQFSPGSVAQVQTGPNAYQTAAADSLVGLMGAQGASSLIAQTGLTPDMIQAQMSPYINAVVNPTMAAQNLQNQQALSNMRGRMGTRGSLGNQTGAEAAYLAGVQPGQQAVIGNLYNQGYQQAASTALQSLQQRLAASGIGTQGAQTLGTLGEQTRQAALQGQMLPFQLTSQMTQSLAPWLQAAGVNFSGESEGASSGTSKTSPGIGNVAAGLLGAWLSSSDPRLKENMRQVGTTFDGQPLYAFNFKPGLGLPLHTQVGLDATEVAQRTPDAVASTPMGLAVNYDRALASAAPRDGMSNGGDVMDKVARAVNLIRGIKREGMASGGEARRGYFLGGLTSSLQSALPSLFGKTESLGTSPGGWDTSVTTDPAQNWQKTGKAFGNYLSSMGQQDEHANAQAQKEGANALSQQQAGLSSMLQSLLPRAAADGGRVGYDDGGITPFWPLAPNYPYAETGRDEPLEPDVADAVYTPGIAGSAPPPFARGLGYSVPPVLGEPPAAPAAAPATAGWGPVVVEREPAAPAAAPSWWERLGPELFPTFYGRGQMHNQDPTALQNIGNALMLISGPMVAGPAGQALMQGVHKRRELDIQKANAKRQALALEQQMEHQRQTLAATVAHHAEQARHNREVEQPAEVRSLIAAGFTPGTPEFREAYLRLRSQNPEKAFDIESAKAAVKQAGDLSEQINTSNAQVQRLNQLEQLLSQPGVPSGRFANWELEGRRIASALFPNVNIEGIAEGEAATALSNHMALAARNAGSGAGMPGAMSDADREFLVKMVPGLTRTPAGNKLLIKVMRETERYRGAANAEAIRYINANRSNVGLQEHMTRWMEANPMSTVIPEHAQTREETAAATSASAQRPSADDVPVMTPAEAVRQGVTRFRNPADNRIYSRPQAPAAQDEPGALRDVGPAP